jgi:hypothetical protein
MIDVIKIPSIYRTRGKQIGILVLGRAAITAVRNLNGDMNGRIASNGADGSRVYGAALTGKGVADAVV